MTNTEIVMKFIGKVQPVGISEEDRIRYNNLKDLCLLVEDLIMEIDTVSYENRNRQEFSRKEMGEYAYRFLTDKIGIPD